VFDYHKTEALFSRGYFSAGCLSTVFSDSLLSLESNLMEQVNSKRVAIFVVSACLIGMIVGSAVSLAALNVQKAIPSSGTVVAVNVGVYYAAACTLNLTSIDWGSVYQGGSVPRKIAL
jgi:hypothetical protein